VTEWFVLEPLGVDDPAAFAGREHAVEHIERLR